MLTPFLKTLGKSMAGSTWLPTFFIAFGCHDLVAHPGVEVSRCLRHRGPNSDVVEEHLASAVCTADTEGHALNAG